MNPQDFLSNTSRWRICDSGHLWFNCSCLSTNIILKGKFDWYNPTARLSPAAESIFNQVSSIKDFPRIPQYVMELQKLLENDNASTQQMANVVKHDSLLSATILKIANNLVPKGSKPIQSLAHGIAFLGIQSFRDMVTVAAISRFKLDCKDFDANAFWEESFLVGRIAEFLTQRLRLGFTPEQAFLAGSCCNIGKIVLAITDPAKADLYTREMNDLNILGSWTSAERRHRGYQHGILGELGASFWGFPEEFLDVIGLHHEGPIPKASAPIALWELIGFANQLSHWVNLEPHRMSQVLLRQYIDRFKMQLKDVEALVDGEMLSLRSAA